MYSANPFSKYDLLPLHEKRKLNKQKKAQFGEVLPPRQPNTPVALDTSGITPIDLNLKRSSAHEQVHSFLNEKEKKPFPMELAYSALLAVDRFIPGEDIDRPVVQPGQSYNENPYGTGSQAIAKYGKKMKYQDGGDPPIKKQSPSVYGIKNNPQFTPNYNFSIFSDKYGTGYGGKDTTMYDIHFQSMVDQEPQALYNRYKYEQYGLPRVGPDGGATDMKIYSADQSKQQAYADALKQRSDASYNMYSATPISRNPKTYAYGGEIGGEDPMKPAKKLPVYNDQTLKEDTDFARKFIERRTGPSFLASNTTVGKVGDPRVQFEYANPQMLDTVPKATSLPTGVKIDDVFQTNTGQYGYMHPQNGSFIVVDPGVIYGRYGQKKDAPVAKLEDGGVIAKDGHWIQKAVNPKHKGYCTPMTKKTCTPKRKALAKTFKKHHGFHEDGGLVPYFEEGGSYDLSDQQIADLISQGYELEMK